MGPLLKFFSLTYLLTWSCFIAFGALSRGTSARPAVAALGGVVLLVGVFAPSLVALWLTTAADGRSGILALLGRLFQWQVGARWYVFAARYTAAVKLTVALVYRLATGAWPRFGYEAWYLMIVATVFSTPGQAGEEIGWRGYALPRLATRFGLGRASVVLGVIWACWHLPLFFIPVSDTYGQSFAVYLLQEMTPFETDIHVPLVVVGPGVPKGRVVDAIVENVDLFETFLEISGASSPASPDGHSLLPLLHGSPVTDWRDAALIEHHRNRPYPDDPDMQVAIAANPTSYEALRIASALYVEYEDGETGYYDLIRDPLELRNVASKLPAAKRKQLHEVLRANMECQGAQACWTAQHLAPESGSTR